MYICLKMSTELLNGPADLLNLFPNFNFLIVLLYETSKCQQFLDALVLVDSRNKVLNYVYIFF